MQTAITGSTAAELAESVRDLLDRGELSAGDALPPVRALADHLGVNRNTVVAGYRQLAQAGVVVTQGRAGTRVADLRPAPEEGFASDSALRDVASNNPDPARLPDLTSALATLTRRPVLYGEPVVDRDLGEWASEWFADDLRTAGGPADFRLSVTSGAVDAVERLLSQSLTRDDAVALEVPCFLASIQTVRLGGYRAVGVPVDSEGMTPDGLRAALDQGVRAVVTTPRAQNPTGVGLSQRRSAQLREVLAEHPYVLVIEDDHFSLLSQQPYRSLVGPEHRRWALVRSVSKFLGPDSCVALVASDRDTAERLALRLRPGTTWVSHLLQRLAHAQLADPDVLAGIRQAGQHYAERNAAFAQLLTANGLETHPGEGLSLWVDCRAPAALTVARLMRRGWLARAGDEFALTAAPEVASRHVRLTVHQLDDDSQAALARDVVAAAAEARRSS
ncbi:aminotransferase class I/II-fold pyridoxal phosphate-dependent enzyme [Nocardioides daphniae]|uniref:Aminotransferase class I/II-fold pyridoxal phosphate-dependent enzyme n=1 Tax=Nocardioides daphniae TaxID=402297 RepID=A0A4P7UAW6_9ACTN|nr:aminotransferase class I/II-fold pyridoxal phosphate-dependent enzyme [Nocardioides daphniae]QCC77210.1 aminotransferase class I/II-fold pyridoxal phosphate-dependent enzyme [Nocardioides daphniae]GGD26663.1 transcriptional regulator PtsJ [Nocardioides daphniae]